MASEKMKHVDGLFIELFTVLFLTPFSNKRGMLINTFEILKLLFGNCMHNAVDVRQFELSECLKKSSNYPILKTMTFHV